MSENNKKAFDSSTCFMFFGSWMKSIETMETDQDQSSNAYRFFKAIAYYSMYDESPDFGDTPMLNALWALVEREIDISIGKRKRGFARDAIDKKYQAIIDALINNPSASLREMAHITGTDKNMVDRVKKKYAQRINDGADNYRDGANASVNADDCDKDNDGDGDNDSIGRDRDRTAGQSAFIQNDNDIDTHETEIAEEEEMLKEWISEQEKNFLPFQTSAIYDDSMPF